MDLYDPELDDLPIDLPTPLLPDSLLRPVTADDVAARALAQHLLRRVFEVEGVTPDELQSERAASDRIGIYAALCLMWSAAQERHNDE